MSTELAAPSGSRRRAALAMVSDALRGMQRGQAIMFSGDIFRDAFPCDRMTSFFTGHESSESVFLSQMVGSAWGAWRCERDPVKDRYKVSRHEESDKRYYVDPDRAWMFRREFDGTLTQICTPSGEVRHG